MKLDVEENSLTRPVLLDTPAGTEQSHSCFQLKNINVSINNGELVAIVGSVGSGKSALLHALLGEMTRRSGSVVLRGSVAYVSQAAFVLNDTVQQNILFGLPMSPERYEHAVRLSCLKYDLESESMPDGDQTEIGERGLTLSGGQKQRVSLARALYRQADIFLFDDCLSALDASVGQEIFDRCITSGLSGTTRLLVTHAIQHLPQCDRVLVLQDGMLVEMGTYSELVSRASPVFQTFVQAHEASIDKMVDAQTNLVKQDTDDYNSPSSPELTPKQANKRKTDDLNKNAKQEELRRKGSVSKAMYWRYVQAAGGSWMLFTIVLFATCNQGSSVATNYFLSYWSDHINEHPSSFFLEIYGALAASNLVIMACGNLVRAWAGVKASRVLHEKLLLCVMKARLSFFLTTQTGQITNRFAQDVSMCLKQSSISLCDSIDFDIACQVYTVDEQLPQTLNMLVMCVWNVLATLILIIAVTPFFAVVILPLSWVSTACPMHISTLL